MLRAVVSLALLLLGLPLVLAAIILLLAYGGSPGRCGAGRAVVVSPALSQSYEQRWLDFNAQLTSGRPSSLTVSDSEATSRARDFLATANAPVSALRLCFVPGGGDANGTISPPFGPGIDVRVKAAMDLSGRHPATKIDSIQIGALPSFLARPFRGLVTRLIDEQTNNIELDHRLSLQISDGQARIDGQP